MTKAQIQAIQREVGVEDDGFFGRVSIDASQAFLRNLMPKPHPWPKADEVSLTKFFGQAGDESALVSIPMPAGFLYDGKPVARMRCHKLVAESLSRILPQILPHVRDYDGCYNFRKMRGGSRLSMHAWGIAVDFAAGENGNLTHWPAKATMPWEVMKIFAREGWLSAGAFWNRDAMHFQATR